jgi:hypothetical protein
MDDFDLEYYLYKFKRHLDSVHQLSRDQQFADACKYFNDTHYLSADRDQAFKNLKSMLISKVDVSIDSRTMVLSQNGSVMVDDVEEHAETSCSSCHSEFGDADVMIAKLRNAGVILKQSKPTIVINFERPVSAQVFQNIKSIKRAIKRHTKYGWIHSTETNLYSKLYGLMPTIGHPILPNGHPHLPVKNYICFTKGFDTDQVNVQQGFFIKTYIKLIDGLKVEFKHN